jgi:hypothetical protein
VSSECQRTMYLDRGQKPSTWFLLSTGGDGDLLFRTLRWNPNATTDSDALGQNCSDAEYWSTAFRSPRIFDCFSRVPELFAGYGRLLGA